MPSWPETHTARSIAERALRDAVRADWPRVVAPLVRILGDVQRAEDCAQDAVVQALETWEERGLPAEPRAWLIRAARNRAIDVIRREARRTPLEQAATDLVGQRGSADGEHDPTGTAAMAELDLWLGGSGSGHRVGGGRDGDGRGANGVPGAGDGRGADGVPGANGVPSTSAGVDDDVLRLVFLCCHPALAPEAQAALCLRLLCGLSTEEIARAFLVPEATMAKRLTRAKDKIAKASIPFAVPPAEALPERLVGAAATVYLLFNEGYSASGGDAPLRPALVDEALRLGRLLHALLPEAPTACGLLALMLLHDSRRRARVDATGEPILLADQDRERWDRSAIVEGTLRLGEGLAHSPEHPDPYVVQAAIAACHALANSWEQTDWAAIVSWYDVLLRIQPTPVVALNRSVAIAERDGPGPALVAVDAIDGLTNYPLWHATRAELLHRLGRDAEAAAAFASALALPLAAPTRRQLERRLDALAQN